MAAGVTAVVIAVAMAVPVSVAGTAAEAALAVVTVTAECVVAVDVDVAVAAPFRSPKVEQGWWLPNRGEEPTAAAGTRMLLLLLIGLVKRDPFFVLLRGVVVRTGRMRRSVILVLLRVLGGWRLVVEVVR